MDLPDPVGGDEARAALARVLESPDFRPSSRRRALLGHLVDETLAGRGDLLKGFSIAVAVFGRDESFDAQSDPVVRIETRRLRRDLDGYYAGEGAADPVRLSIPKGAYVVRFDRIAAAPEPEADGAGVAAPDPAPGPRWTWPAAGVAAIAVVAALATVGWAVFRPAPEPVLPGEPVVVVMPFDTLTGSGDAAILATGIGHELIADLMRFHGLRLYSRPPATDADGNMAAVPAQATFVVRGGVGIEGDRVFLGVRVEEAATGRVLWGNEYERDYTPGALLSIGDTLAADIATVLGQPYGVIGDELSGRDPNSVRELQSYLCVLRAYTYRRSFTRDEFEPVFDCLRAAVRREPGYSDAWAMLGWLHMDAGRFGFAPADRRQAEYEAGLQAAQHALDLRPDSVLALKALSSINHYLQRYEDSERLARRAVALNPHDPDALAQLGWRLAARGRFEEGIPLLRRAIERTVDPPGWTYHLIAVDHLMRGEFEQMLAVAERSAVDGSLVSQVLIAIPAAELCRTDTLRAALDRIAAVPSFDRDPGAVFRLHGATDAIVGQVESGLDRARQRGCD